MNRRESIIFCIAALVFLSFNFIELRTTWETQFPLFFALPHSYTGDEVHHLVIAASIIKDLDFDVSNNYNDAKHKGTNDLGGAFAGRWVNHHTTLVDPDTREAWPWFGVVDYDLSNLWKPASEVPFRFRQEYQFLQERELVEYSMHEFGLGIFLSIFLWPFRWFPYSMLFNVCAILVMSLFCVLALYLLYQILAHFVDRKKALLFTGLFAFCTPIWWYSRALYPESLMFILLVVSVWFLLIKRNFMIPGILLGFAILVKPYFGIFGVLLWIWLLLEKRYRDSIYFLILFISIGSAQLWINQYTMGNIARFPRLIAPSDVLTKSSQLISEPGRFLLHRIDLLCNKSYGFLTFAPFLIYSLIAMFRYAGTKGTRLISLLNIGFFLLVLINGWMATGHSYAGRYFVPIIPLLAIPTLQWYNASRRKIGQAVFWILVVISFLISLQSASMYGASVDNPPWFLIKVVRNILLG